MVSATLYVITCSARNRINRRLRRLREGRYLLGAVVGIVYLVFALILRDRAYDQPDMPSGSSGASLLSLLGPAAASFGGVLLAGASAAAWLLPFGSHLLEFSRAETELLFPAPVTRLQLVTYRLMRSQAAVLTGALIVALAYPTGAVVSRLQGMIGVWLVLMASHAFFAVVTLARAQLRRRDGPRAFAWLALLVPVCVVAMVVADSVRAMAGSPIVTGTDAVQMLTSVAQQGSASVVLAPFTWLVRPLVAGPSWEFFGPVAGAAAVYGAVVLWLVWADRASPEQSGVAPPEHHATGSGRAPKYVARPAAWRLAATGSLEWAFVWKSALQTLRAVDQRVLLRASVFLAAIVGATLFMTQARGLVLAVGVFATWGALLSMLMAPQMVRMDLREDLAHLELLKSWPVRGQTVLRGEIVWPASVVTALAWSFGAVASAMSLMSSSRVPFGNRGAFWLSILILIPGVVLAQYTIHNGMAVVFPGWVRLGRSRPRGVDAVGQRLIVLAVTWVGLAVALLPGAAVSVMLFSAFGRAARVWVLPVGAMTTTACVVLEMLLVTRALGRVFDRLDMSSVERPEY